MLVKLLGAWSILCFGHKSDKVHVAEEVKHPLRYLGISEGSKEVHVIHVGE